MKTQLALDTMRSRDKTYDAAVLDAFVQVLGDRDAQQKVMEIPLRNVQEGMVLTDDVYTKTGALLVARGFVVTSGFMKRWSTSPRTWYPHRSVSSSRPKRRCPSENTCMMRSADRPPSVPASASMGREPATGHVVVVLVDGMS